MPVDAQRYGLDSSRNLPTLNASPEPAVGRASRNRNGKVKNYGVSERTRWWFRLVRIESERGVVRTCKEKIEGDGCEEEGGEPEGIIEEEVAHELSVEHSEIDTRNAARLTRVSAVASVQFSPTNVPSPQGPP
jgi:hypothetical protein